MNKLKIAAAICAGAGLLGITSAPAAASARTKKLPKQLRKHILQVRDSINWSGYASINGPFESVEGAWQITNVKHSAQAAANATWIGIGGILGNDLIQSGTETDTSPDGGVSYQAWIEMLPNPPFQIPVAVSSGNSVNVKIQKIGRDFWNINFKNLSTGQSYSANEIYRSSLSSAEWIEEAPSSAFGGVIPIDKFGSVHFRNAYALHLRRRETLAQTGAMPINLIDSLGRILAQTSKISKRGSGFAVKRTKISPISQPNFLFRAVKRMGSVFK